MSFFAHLSGVCRSGTYVFIFQFLFSVMLSAEQIKPLLPDAESGRFGEWFSVNDGVMGGVSEGGFLITEENTLRFAGILSLENNGGFASIRTRLATDLPASLMGLRLSVRGDGRSYYLDLRNRRQSSATSFRAPLPTRGGEFEEIIVPLSSFEYTRFGRRLNGPPLMPAEIGSIGFTLADSKEGPFRMEIRSIDLVLTDAVEVASNRTPTALIEKAIERGVPLFNGGNEAACRAVYEIACEALLLLPDLPEGVREDIGASLRELPGDRTEAEKAWRLRYAMDRTLVQLAGD
jgi:NADH dehydrogenase [ubiquinone] 1 alpha subcomplex assembly factor 1